MSPKPTLIEKILSKFGYYNHNTRWGFTKVCEKAFSYNGVIRFDLSKYPQIKAYIYNKYVDFYTWDDVRNKIISEYTMSFKKGKE